MDKYLTQKEVAEKIRMSEAWLERKRWEGRGIPYRKLGRAVRYSATDVERYMAENKKL